MHPYFYEISIFLTKKLSSLLQWANNLNFICAHMFPIIFDLQGGSMT